VTLKRVDQPFWAKALPYQEAIPVTKLLLRNSMACEMPLPIGEKNLPIQGEAS
jgi:hypothetical protein